MKYIGSKQRISKKIVPLIEKGLDACKSGLYIEPFVGGANVIDKVVAPCKIGADANKYLIALLTAAQRGVALPDTITRAEYDAVRNDKQRYPEWYVGLVGFCASYNAKFFGGYANGVKTKEGTVRNYTDEAIKNLKKQAPALAGTHFVRCDYSSWSYIEGAMIYCDPPYAGVTGYDGNTFDTSAFFDWCRMMGQHNVVLISEYAAPPDFLEVAGFNLKTTLDKKQKIERTERLFTIGRGTGVFDVRECEVRG